jgi:citronellyl-CoA synthetase
LLGCGLYGASGVALRRKFSAREFWEDVRKYNASAIGYVGELCRYLMEVPAKPEDRAHRVTKMVGNGMRPTFGVHLKSVLALMKSMSCMAPPKATLALITFSTLTTPLAFHHYPTLLLNTTKKTTSPVLDNKGLYD